MIRMTQIIDMALRAGRTFLTEPEAKRMCKEYSISVPSFEVVRTEEEAIEVSKDLGFPLVAKVVSPKIIHKTDAEGIVLGIKSQDDLVAAYRKILKRVKAREPRASVEGILLERMEAPGIEVIVGAMDDPQFGKVLMFGLGGIFAELFRDVTFRLAPITGEEAKEMIRRIRSYRLLRGFRHFPRLDEDALREILLAVSKIVTENKEVIELDLNPIIVKEEGATAVDARVILSKDDWKKSAERHPANSLLNFFRPESVAVIGASRTAGKIGHEIFRNLSQYQYTGKVYPVNQSAESVLGQDAYRSILELPGKIDLAVVTAPAKVAPSVIDECGRKGVRNVIIVSGGFRETGSEELERETVEAARKYSIRTIGPNCNGVFDGHSRLDTFFHSHDRMLRPKGGRVAFITQSGTFGVSALDWAAEKGIGISKLVSYGNRCDVDEGDLIEFLGIDNETSVICMYLEGIGDGRKLFDAARKIAPRKPIVVVKAGRTSLGSRAAKSHTGGLAGSYEVAKAAFEQAGMIVAEDIEELFDVVKALAMQPLPIGGNVAMVTNGAGPCVMAADRFEEYNMTITPLSAATTSELTLKLPSYCLVSETTIDLTASGTAKDYEAALRILAEDPNVHVLMPFFVLQSLDENIVEVLSRIGSLGKTIVCCALGGRYTTKISKMIEQLNIPVYEIAERAVASTRALIYQGAFRKTAFRCSSSQRLA